MRVTDIDAYSPFSLGNFSPTSVNVAGLNGRGLDNGSILLEWQTASEENLLGFSIYRAESATVIPVRINADLIPSLSPGSVIGGSYSYLDRIVAPSSTYYYWLDVIEIGGHTGRYGPVSVVAGTGSLSTLYLPLITITR